MDKKWNLQDIKPANPGRKRPQGGSLSVESSEPESVPVRKRTPTPPRDSVRESTPVDSIVVENGNVKKSRKLILAGGILTMIFLCIIGASLFLKGADITVYPRFRELTVNAEFTALKNPQVDELSYEVMTLEAEGERQVAATGKQAVSEQAEGTITIVKSTPGTQRLIKNTRFEDQRGQIYRITESVVVPGAVDGTPGRIQADVFADEAGESYNAPAGTRLTIPGLESDADLFNAMYAENEEAFIGGFSGEKFIIDENELKTARQALQQELRDGLLEKLPGEQPAGFVAFDDATSFIFESLPAVAYGEDLATIKERAILQIPLFKEDDFASFIATATVPGYEGLPVRIDDYEVFSFGYVGTTTRNTNIANLEELTFKLIGTPLIVWSFDEGKLATDLLGVNQTALNQVLQAYPAIERAQAEIRPFWKRTFPTNLNEISISEVVQSDDGAVE